MMRSSVGVLDEYGKAFRDLINVKMGSRDKSVRELLRLNKDDDSKKSHSPFQQTLRTFASLTTGALAGCLRQYGFPGVISESVVTNCRMCILLAKQHVGAFVRK